MSKKPSQEESELQLLDSNIEDSVDYFNLPDHEGLRRWKESVGYHPDFPLPDSLIVSYEESGQYYREERQALLQEVFVQ